MNLDNEKSICDISINHGGIKQEEYSNIRGRTSPKMSRIQFGSCSSFVPLRYNNLRLTKTMHFVFETENLNPLDLDQDISLFMRS